MDKQLYEQVKQARREWFNSHRAEMVEVTSFARRLEVSGYVDESTQIYRQFGLAVSFANEVNFDRADEILGRLLAFRRTFLENKELE